LRRPPGDCQEPNNSRAVSKQNDLIFSSLKNTQLRHLKTVPEEMEHAKSVWKQYLDWVGQHPKSAADVETSLKWIALIATGKKYFL
jgi:hypothetical protein